MLFWETLQFTLGVTAPIFFWIGCGFVLKNLGWLTAAMIDRGSWLMFYVFLPLLMFISMVRKPLDQSFDPMLILLSFGVTSLVWWLASKRAGLAAPNHPVYVQGALRGNLGIIGVSLCLNAYGPELFLEMAVPMALLAVFYNIVCTLIFVNGRRPQASDAGGAENSGRPGASRMQQLFKLLSNPLIGASLLGLVVNLAPVQLPLEAVDGVLQLLPYTFPIALLCVGGSLTFQSLLANRQIVLEVAGFKLLLMPLAAVLLGWLLGYQGAILGMLFLLSAAPTATASFIMAKSYGANGNLAADIIVGTTLMSLLTLSAGVFVLRSLNLM